MRLDIHVHNHGDDNKLSMILAGIEAILKGMKTMSADLTKITSEVAETRTVVESAVVLLDELGQLIRDNADDPAALRALADDLDSQQAALAAAVAANTPSVPTDPIPPVEPEV